MHYTRRNKNNKHCQVAVLSPTYHIHNFISTISKFIEKTLEIIIHTQTAPVF